MGTFIIVMLCIAVYAFLGGITYKLCLCGPFKNYVDDEVGAAMLGIFWPFGFFFISGIWVVRKIEKKMEDS